MGKTTGPKKSKIIAALTSFAKKGGIQRYYVTAFLKKQPLEISSKNLRKTDFF